jgi:hypothetical protein
MFFITTGWRRNPFLRGAEPTSLAPSPLRTVNDSLNFEHTYPLVLCKNHAKLDGYRMMGVMGVAS